MKTFLIILLAAFTLSFVGCAKQKDVQEKNSKVQVEKPKMPIHMAIVRGDVEVVKLHIKAGSDLNEREPMGNSTPLISAATFGQFEIAKALIKAGAELNFQNKDGSTALLTAAFFCHKDIVKELLDSGADKSLRNSFGNTALELMQMPFNKIKPVYEQIEPGLKPLGVSFDYDHMEKTRPMIAEMLKG